MLATTHVHLDEDYCAEAVMMRGRASELREVADLMRRQKGVLHAALSMSAVGPGLGRTPAHRHSRAHSHPHAHPH